MLRLVLPKGSLERSTFDLFEAADLPVRRESDRTYNASIDDPRVSSVAIMRPQEIPKYIEEGFFDLGISGQDLIAEAEADVVEIARLSFSKSSSRPVQIVLAMAESSGVTTPDQIPPDVRVCTEYMNIARRYFERLGTPARVIRSYGSNEAKVPHIVDATIHNMETDTTLRLNGLRVVDTLMESWTVLIAGRKTMEDSAKAHAVEELRILLDGALQARGRVLVKLNVAALNLDAVLRLLPSMKAPTVSKLANGDDFAVETVVEKVTINLLIPELKAAGAEDIIELPLSKIVP